jgi:ubiquinone/menaquinone biosynthesis C-methylase UbiE
MARMAQHVVAIDIDADLLSLARRRVSEALTNCQFVVADAYGLRANVVAPVDFVFLANAFQGVPDTQRLCNSVAETLLPGGQFAVVN